MALPQLAEFEEALQMRGDPVDQPQNLQARIQHLSRLALDVEQEGRQLTTTLARLRAQVESHVLEHGASLETNEYIAAVLKMLRSNAAYAESTIFDANAGDKRLSQFGSRISTDQRRMIRRSAMRVESAQRNLVAITRQNADALEAFYEQYLSSPPDPWPPEVRND